MKQNYRKFMENSEYQEESEIVAIPLDRSRGIKIRNGIIALLVAISVGSIAGGVWQGKNYHELIQKMDHEIVDLKEKAYDSTGREWQARFNEIDKQYHNIVQNMNELGYDMAFN